MKIKIIERGWAGHFICSQDCLFRRNTLLQKDNTFIVVSTVGCMRTRDYDGSYKEPESIGADRYYETMAFYSDKSDTIYHDMDVSKQIYASSDVKWSINSKELKAHKNDIDNIANRMHDNYVRKICLMMRKGEL